MQKVINVSAVLDSPSALTQEQGKKVYKLVSEAIKDNDDVILDFDGIESMISPFLNNAIGKLYGEFSSDELNGSLKLKNFPPEKKSTLVIVVENAKKYYLDKDKYNSVIKDVIG